MITLTEAQQRLLHDLYVSGPMAVHPVGSAYGNNTRCRKALLLTPFVEPYINKDAAEWMRLTRKGGMLVSLLINE